MNLRKITAAALSLALACGIAAPFGISPKASGVSAVTANAADTEYKSLTLDKCTYNVYPDHAAFNRCSVTVEGAIVIPEEVEGVPVTKINSHAFEKCGKLTSVSIPVTVTEIGTTLAMNCHEMQVYRVDGKNPAFCALDGVLFTKDMKSSSQFRRLILRRITPFRKVSSISVIPLLILRFSRALSFLIL